MSERWLIYGAYGFTGELIARRARAVGEAPILAGRDAARLGAVAEALGLEARVVALDDGEALRAALDGVRVVVHAAGPFARTSRPMVDACLAAGAHYVDVTGELEVFEACAGRDAEARAAGVVLLPGAGMDVVPTDCLAVALAERLPGATHLALAYHATGAPSAGTAATIAYHLGDGGWERREGALVRVPIGARTREVAFADQHRRVHGIPWGDLATAWRSTRIPNIVVYASLPPEQVRLLRAGRLARPLLAAGPVRRFLERTAARRTPNPDARELAEGRTEFWGEVSAPDGRAVSGTLTTPNGYTLTAHASVEIARRLLGAPPPAPGYHTPATAFGAGLVTDLEGVTLHPLVEHTPA